MSGIALLSALALWLFVAHRITLFATRRVESNKRVWAYAGVVALVLPLPVADEIVAGIQLESKCREGAVMTIDAQKIKGRRVKVASEPLNAPVPGVAVPVTYSKLVMRDAETGEVLGSRGRYVVKGGLLIRTLGISESDSPLFARSFCAPAGDVEQEASRLGFDIVN